MLRLGGTCSRPKTRVETLARKHGFVFVDTTPAFEGTYLMDYSVLPTDRHPNAAANLMFELTCLIAHSLSDK